MTENRMSLPEIGIVKLTNINRDGKKSSVLVGVQEGTAELIFTKDMLEVITTECTPEKK